MVERASFQNKTRPQLQHSGEVHTSRRRVRAADAEVRWVVKPAGPLAPAAVLVSL